MCIHLNLMIFTKIIRGFISAQQVLAVCTLSQELLTKHNFNKVFPVPQFTFNHNNLSYNYGYSTETIYRADESPNDFGKNH